MKVDKPSKVKKQRQASYPTLEDFAQNRRRFLKDIASGALCLSLGGLTACLGDGSRSSSNSPNHVDGGTPRLDTGWYNQPDSGDADSGPQSDAAIETGYDATPDQSPDSTVEEEWIEPPYAGGMPEPEYYHVRLPSSDYAPFYSLNSNYMSIALELITYDADQATFLQTEQEQALAECLGALCEYTCDDLNDASSVETVCQEMMNLLNNFYATQSGSYGSIHTVELLVGSCHEYYDIDGDVAEPEFPYTCE